MEKEIDLRRLVIKAFHITEVEEGGENKVTASGKMTIEKKILDEILPKYPQLSKSFRYRPKYLERLGTGLRIRSPAFM